MVWLHRRSSMAVKARLSTFETFAGRRSSSFDMISVLPGNRPMESPAVVEDVGHGLSSSAGDVTQAQCPRGRFFGLKLGLPLFGSKEDAKRAGPRRISATSGVWRYCQTASDVSDNDGERPQRQAEARARLLAQYGAAPRKPNFGDTAFQQPAHSIAFPVPLPPRILDNTGIVHGGYVRNVRSLDVPSTLGSGDHFHIAHWGPMSPNLVIVEDSQDQGSPGSKSKASKQRWAERTSRQISSIASRFRRKSQQRSKKRGGDTATGHASIDYPAVPRAEYWVKLDRRKSTGAARGNNCDGYNAPGPEGSRGPPDNVFIPSGPPCSVYIPTVDSSQSKSLSMDSSTAQVPMVPIDPRTGTATPLYGSRWSYESGYVLHAPLAIWYTEPAIDEHGGMTGDADDTEGADCSQAPTNGVVCRPEEALEGLGSGTVSSIFGESTLDGEGFQRRRGLDVSMSGQQLPHTQSPVHRAPPDCERESANGLHKTFVEGSAFGSACTPSRSHKPARKETMAKKIFGASSHTETTPQLCHSVGRTDSFAPSIVPSDGGAASKPRLRPQMSLPEWSQGTSAHDVCAEPEFELPIMRLAGRCTPEMPPLLNDSMMADSLDCWNKYQWGDRAKNVAESVTQSECDDARPRMRPSICLSDEPFALPAPRPESEPLEHERMAGSCSGASFQGRVNPDFMPCCSSDGPLYHRSMFYKPGFSSKEECDADGDDGSHYTPSQFVLHMNAQHGHRRWHSDCLHGISAVRYHYMGTSRYQLHCSLGQMDRLSDIRSNYTRTYDGYPACPGYSFRSGFCDLLLPEFRSCRERDLYGGTDKLEHEKKPRKSWLDELQDKAELRRKECTYRIACQRAILQNMKESLQASKLAFDRIKLGLCPRLTSGVAELRRRWGGSGRVQRRNKLAKALKKEEDSIWEDIPLVI